MKIDNRLVYLEDLSLDEQERLLQYDFNSKLRIDLLKKQIHQNLNYLLNQGDINLTHLNILNNRFGLRGNRELTVKETAKKFKMMESEVQEKESYVLMKLRNPVISDKLKDFYK